ncbi:hypothetical protein LOK49_LG13G00600 [Camellia lanceoleosa]|uniref:Uncharacterized protein n=1 Tax=Camellia lanceoleosa TaxID=1840588 RepID=A0ACC0FKR8_9ERIC|nr:hypothetical protein LOK49_LG13G00600 [Camellia lanceoleosa]
MTTTARPTWAPAKGGNEQGGTRIFSPSKKYSSRDIASHTTLKPRLELLQFPHFKDGQDTKEELQKRNLRDELEEREWRHFSSKDKSYSGRETIEIVENEATFYWKGQGEMLKIASFHAV